MIIPVRCFTCGKVVSSAWQPFLDRTLIVPDTRRKLPKKPLGRGARKKRQKSYR